MEVYEITGFSTGVDRTGVNFLEPKDAFEIIKNGYIYRQELQSRKGFVKFGNRLGTQVGETTDSTRVMGIFENVLPDGTKELLVASKKFLYSYNTGTGLFDQILFNSAVAIVDFGIADNEDYISGTTYLKKDGSQRFVFTGKGMTDVYFYDGTDVKRFTNTTDNPDYIAPAEGPLTKATKIIWFGERLNLFSPEINAIVYQQGVLYSGIRTASGNGDKFNVAGSGLLSADTYELMRGAIIRGDIIIMNFERSNWVLEKTRDAFNPYFVRKIPSVLGTDAAFSAVSWAESVKSAGRTGMVTTNGNVSLLFDNKIPYFTRDEIDPVNFGLTYGGFERDNGQFLFAYRESGSTLTEVTQDKVLTYNYKEETWSINDQRFSVFGQSDEGLNLIWNDIDENINPEWLEMDTTEEIWDKIGIGKSVQKTLAGDDEGYIYQLNVDYDDYFSSITGITHAAEAVISTESAFKPGDKVYLSNVEGMTEINGISAIVLSSTDTDITINIDSTNFTAYTGEGNVSKYIIFETRLIPFNPYRSQGLKCYVSHVEFMVNNGGSGFYVDVYEDEETTPFKTCLIEPRNTNERLKEWVNMSVNQESNFLTFVLRNETVSNKLVITSIRIQ